MSTPSYDALHQEMQRYAGVNGVPIARFSPLECVCGQRVLRLRSDDDEGAAAAICPACKVETDIHNSFKYGKNPVWNICACDAKALLLSVGVATHQDTDEVRWIYVGGHCQDCGLSGVYVDWNER